METKITFIATTHREFVNNMINAGFEDMPWIEKQYSDFMRDGVWKGYTRRGGQFQEIAIRKAN